MKPILLSALFLILPMVASAQYREPDVNCDNHTFEIVRSDGFHGDMFNWRFKGHLLEHFLGNRVLTRTTRTRVAQETYYGIYIDSGRASINVGSSFATETRTQAYFLNGPDTVYLRLTRDPRSSGYFVTAYAGHTADHKITDYYFHNCQFGKKYSAH
jgi:hypothetical protein